MMEKDLEGIRDIVVNVCEDGYLFVDDITGFALIERNDISSEGDGIYVARFRLKPEKRPLLGLLEARIDAATGMHVQSFVAESVEYGIPYLNVALVISERTNNV